LKRNDLSPALSFPQRLFLKSNTMKNIFFKDKKVFITGAASGIGKATAVAMGALGCRLFLTDINEQGLLKTAAEIQEKGGKVCAAEAFDVSDYPMMKHFASDVQERHGAMDILVNVAGIALFSQIEDMKHGDWERVINVNLWGVIHALECFVPEMIRARRGGHIVNVSSTAGLIGLPWHAAYAASKHAVVGLSEVLRYDLKKHGIAVSVICPGAVNTGLVKTAEIHANDLQAAQKAKARFANIAINPERVAQMIMRAVRRRRFIVLTSFDVRLFYFLKKCCPCVYQ